MTRTKTTFDNARGNFVNSHPAPGFYTYLRTANENNCTLRNMERLSNSHGRTHTFTDLRAHNWTHRALFDEERGGITPSPLPSSPNRLFICWCAFITSCSRHDNALLYGFVWAAGEDAAASTEFVCVCTTTTTVLKSDAMACSKTFCYNLAFRDAGIQQSRVHRL